MTRGLGLSIGTARAIAVSMSEDGTSTVSRRSTLTFGTQSTVRLGDDPGGEGVVAEFAHRPGEVRVAGDGYRYTGQDLIAAAAYCLVAEANPPEDVPIVLTTAAAHPEAPGTRFEQRWTVPGWAEWDWSPNPSPPLRASSSNAAHSVTVSPLSATSTPAAWTSPSWRSARRGGPTPSSGVRCASMSVARHHPSPMTAFRPWNSSPTVYP